MFQVIIQQKMQKKQVQDLIESIVRPLREKIAHLQKKNQRLKTQINSFPHPARHDYLRQRSKSKQQRPPSKKQEEKDLLPPSLAAAKRKQQKVEKPVWGYARTGKPQIQIKSPQPKDKAPPLPTSPKAMQRSASKEKLDSQKRIPDKAAEKKISGGKKVEQSVEHPTNNESVSAVIEEIPTNQ